MEDFRIIDADAKAKLVHDTYANLNQTLYDNIKTELSENGI